MRSARQQGAASISTPDRAGFGLASVRRGQPRYPGSSRIRTASVRRGQPRYPRSDSNRHWDPFRGLPLPLGYGGRGARPFCPAGSGHGSWRAVRELPRRSGASDAEIALPLPGDDLVPAARDVVDRARPSTHHPRTSGRGSRNWARAAPVGTCPARRSRANRRGRRGEPRQATVAVDLDRDGAFPVGLAGASRRGARRGAGRQPRGRGGRRGRSGPPRRGASARGRGARQAAGRPELRAELGEAGRAAVAHLWGAEAEGRVVDALGAVLAS